MSDIEDDDMFGSSLEEGEEEELDEEEENFNKNMKETAEMLKRKRMMQKNRPSTIVQVSTGPLELHLQSMKKQLKEHAALIEHPPFLDDLMLEVNKISGLVRKIEHCQLDINNVRESIVECGSLGSETAEQKKQKEESSAVSWSTGEKMEQLFKDLEALRTVIRRVDVHHALDANVLVKVKKLAKGLHDLRKYTEKMYTKNMQVIQDELRGEIKSLHSRLQQLDDSQIDKINNLMERIKSTEEIVADGHREEAENMAKKVEHIEQNLTKDFYSFKDIVSIDIEETKQAAIKALKKSSLQAQRNGIGMVEKVLEKFILSRMRRRFRRWQNFDPHGALARGREFITLMNKAHKKNFLWSALLSWKDFHTKQKNRERFKLHMKNIVLQWKELAFPVISKRFNTWKRYCVLMRFHMIERKELENSNAAKYEEKYENLEYQALLGKINPDQDLHGSFQMTGLYIDRIYNKIRRLNDDLNNGNEATKRIGYRIDGVKNDLQTVIEKRCAQVEKQQQSHSQTINTRMRELRLAQDKESETTSKKFNKTNNELSMLEGAVEELTLKVDYQTSQLERLFALHQKMLDRIDSVEQSQKDHASQLSALSENMEKASKSNVRNESEIMLNKHIAEKSLSDIKMEISNIQSTSLDCSNKVQGALSNQMQMHSALSSLSQELKSKMKNLESWLNTTAPKPPSPKLLVSLAVKFEDRAVEKHSHDPAHTFSVSMSTELAKDIATCAHWLVYHIVEATDVDVLTRVMKGPQSMTTVYDEDDVSNSLDAVTKEGEAKLGNLSHEEFCTTTRESMLLRYLEKFQKLLNQSRDEVGSIRKEARALFLKRFIDALDLCLQKHDVIVLNASSATGRNAKHASGRSSEGIGQAACMACDRPLKYRTTTRSIGELFERISSSNRKTLDVKREVLYSQIMSSQQNFVLSDQHGGKAQEVSYSADDDPRQSSEGFEIQKESRRGHKITKVSAPAHLSRPRSAIVQSQSTNQLYSTPRIKSPHLASPSKGGGFKTVNTRSQEALATSIANDLPLETSIPQRHVLKNVQTESRKLIGKFEEEGRQKPIDDEAKVDFDDDASLDLHVPQPETDVRGTVVVDILPSPSNGLVGSFGHHPIPISTDSVETR